MNQPITKSDLSSTLNLHELTERLLAVYGQSAEETPIGEHDNRDTIRDLNNTLSVLDSNCSIQEVIDKAAEKVHDGWVESMSKPLVPWGEQTVKISDQQGFPREFEIFANSLGTISVLSEECNNTERRSFALKGVSIPETFLQTPQKDDNVKGKPVEKLNVYLTDLKDRDLATYAKLIAEARKRYNQMQPYNFLSAAEKMKDIMRVRVILDWLVENLGEFSNYINSQQAKHLEEYLREKESWILLEKPDEHYYSLKDTNYIKRFLRNDLLPEKDRYDLEPIEETYLEYVRYKLNDALSDSIVCVLTFDAFKNLCLNIIGKNNMLEGVLTVLMSLYQNGGDSRQLKSEKVDLLGPIIAQKIFAATSPTVEA